ncbi:interleukin-34-like isoform X2 [Coregonus clupeaformis]|uniref:interleukin-34-like isoform X2 n=1 Tax=Coregonus clupeaformis TaxID=59861 RepID=UPI001BE0AE54|nr:interleukin-34-like isoform X2 [Coregonus clupeaformis]
MVRPTAWLLGGLLGLMWVIPVLMTPTTIAQCTSLKTLETKLTDRRRNMRVRVVDLEEGDLQDVWLLVNQEVLKRILRVLPERHPSYKYTADLEDLFRKVQQVFPPQSDEKEPPERIEDIYNRVKEPDSKGWRFVTPKSLLDNCYRTMHCLFKNCFPSEDGEQDCEFTSFPYYTSCLHLPLTSALTSLCWHFPQEHKPTQLVWHVLLIVSLQCL